MKKLLLLLAAVIGIGLSANAQMCKFTGNVEWKFTDAGGSTVDVTFSNNNAYKVTVTAIIKVLNRDGEEKEYNRTLVIDANREKTCSALKTKSGLVAKDDCYVEMIVQKCD